MIRSTRLMMKKLFVRIVAVDSFIHEIAGLKHVNGRTLPMKGKTKGYLERSLMMCSYNRVIW